MNDNKYLGDITYGDIYVNILPNIIPLGLWCYFIYKYYYNYYKTKTNYSFIFLLLLLLPFILILIQIIVNKDILFSDNNILKTDIWATCLTLPKNDKNDENDKNNKNDENDKNNKNDNSNILGIWSYECGKNQIISLEYLMKQLQYKFYYLNHTLFLLLLIYHKFVGFTNIKNISQNYRIIFICIALFCGSLGVLPTSFGEGYAWSLVAIMIFSTILNMNIAAFLIVLYTLYIEIM